MGVLYDQASFKNSRVSSRQPTTQGYTDKVDLPADGNNHKILDADPTRTYMTLRNNSLVDDLRYSYSDLATMATEGQIIGAQEGADLEAPTEVWARNMGAANINITIDVGQG